MGINSKMLIEKGRKLYEIREKGYLGERELTWKGK